MKTLEEYEAEETAKNPHLSKDFTDHQAAHRHAADRHKAEVEALIAQHHDPAAARELYERHTSAAAGQDARLRRLRELLRAHGRKYSNKALYLERDR